MGENARKPPVHFCPTHKRFEVWPEPSRHLSPDEWAQLEADIEAGAALNSDEAERVLAEALHAQCDPDDPMYEWHNHPKQAQIALTALRKGLAPEGYCPYCNQFQDECICPDDETIARVMGKVGRLDVDD